MITDKSSDYYHHSHQAYSIIQQAIANELVHPFFSHSQNEIMSSKSGSKSSTPAARPGPSLKIKLKVPPEILAKLSKQVKSKTESSKTSSPAPVAKTTSPPEDIKDEKEKSEANGVDVHNDDDDKKKVELAKNGLKRDASTLGTTTAPKSRSRPGPKRRRMYVPYIIYPHMPRANDSIEKPKINNLGR